MKTLFCLLLLLASHSVHADITMDCKMPSLINEDGTYEYREIGPETTLTSAGAKVEECPSMLIHSHQKWEDKRVMHLKSFNEKLCQYYSNTGIWFHCFKD